MGGWGWIILPNANVKIFLTASPECRARRRYDELVAKGQNVKYEDVLAEMNSRDNADSSREIAPTKAADDAVLLDNSELDFEQSVDAVIAIVREKVGDEANG